MTTEQKSKLSKNLFQKKSDPLGQHFFTLFVELQKGIIYFKHMLFGICLNLIDLIRDYIIKNRGAGNKSCWSCFPHNRDDILFFQLTTLVED